MVRFVVGTHPSQLRVAGQQSMGGVSTDITSGQCGNTSYTVTSSGNLNDGACMLQLWLRIDF
jgi:hypothetical protein